METLSNSVEFNEIEDFEKIKLEPGETVCEQCNGLSVYCRALLRHVSFDYCVNVKCYERKVECTGMQYCSKCKGTGKFDWLEKIFGKKNESIVFQRINIRRLLLLIRKSISEDFLETATSQNGINYLENVFGVLKRSRLLQEYKVENIPKIGYKNNYVISIKPILSADIIQMNLVVK